MKTAKQAFLQFIHESSELEVKMEASTRAAHDAVSFDYKHPGAHGGFKPFKRGLEILEQCSVHLPDYTKEQVDLLVSFSNKLLGLLVAPPIIGLEGAGSSGYLGSKNAYYNDRRTPKEHYEAKRIVVDTAGLGKTAHRLMQSRNMHGIFMQASARFIAKDSVPGVETTLIPNG